MSHFHDMAQLNSTSPAPKLLSVSMHLGVSVRPNAAGVWEGHEREGNVVWECLKELKKEFGIECLQIGWVGTQVPRSKHDALTTELMLKHSCYPLFMTDGESEDFYHRFCKGVLWPTMNYSLANSRRFQGIEQLWGTYNKVMHYIADAVATHFRSGDVIWIHDYHLLCLPAFIRNRIPNAKIGFFLHCTFPSSELFRQIPIRESVLLGLCAADVIGFQTYNYCRYFLRSVSVLLDWHCGPTSVTDPQGRVTRVYVNPTGLTVSLYKTKLSQPDVRETAELWRRSTYANSKIVVGRCNRLDKYQGIVEKLLAFDHFLATYTEYIGKVVLIQSILDNEQVDRQDANSSAQVEEVHEERSALTERVQELVGRINGIHGTLGWQPVHIHIKPSDSIENSLALDRIANVVMITPTRDGMNLIAHESVLATSESHAPLILSEFAGAASCLGGSLIVNPYDKAGMAEAIKKALEMGPAEKAKNHSYNLTYVERNTSLEWARTCVEEIIREPAVESRTRIPLQGGELEAFLAEYAASEGRMVLIDYEGTMVHPSNVGFAETQPPCAVYQDLKKLAASPNTVVYVLSGYCSDVLMEGLGIEKDELVEFGLCAKHGLQVRHPMSSDWELTEQEVDAAWMETVRPLLFDFCSRTPGTEIQEQAMSLAWLYDKADQGFARWLVKDLVLVLHQLADQYPIAIAVTPTSVEIRPQCLTRGSVVKQLLSKHASVPIVYHFGSGGSEKDVIDAFGNMASSGYSDRPAAAAAEAEQGSNSNSSGDRASNSFTPQGSQGAPKFVSCAVGPLSSPQQSSYFIADLKEVTSMVHLLCEASQPE